MQSVAVKSNKKTSSNFKTKIPLKSERKNQKTKIVSSAKSSKKISSEQKKEILQKSQKVRSVSFSINCEMMEKINSYCAKRGCSKSFFVSLALENYLCECLEDQEDYERAVAAWEEFEASGEEAIPSSVARKMLGV